MPVSAGAFLVWLAFPALLVAAILYAPYVVVRYRVLLADGEGDKNNGVRRRFLFIGAVLSVGAYAFLLAGILRPNLLPSLSRWIESGRLALIVPVIFVNLLLGAMLSRDRALEKRRSRYAEEHCSASSSHPAPQ